MQYCFQETFARLFYNASSSFFLLFFFFYFTSIFLTRAFNFLGGNLFSPRNQTDQYEFGTFSDEEEEEEDEEDNGKVFEEENSLQDDHDLEANILDGGQSLFFVPAEISHDDQQSDENVATSSEEGYEEEEDDDEREEDDDEREEEEEEEYDDEREEEEVEEEDDEGEEEKEEDEDCDSDNLSVYGTPALESLDGQVEREEEILIEIPARRDTHDIDRNKFDPTSTRTTSTMMNKHKKSVQIMDNQEAKCEKRDGNHSNRHDPSYLDFAPSKTESKKLMNIVNDQEDVFGDTCTIGSTSKDSSEWRSSHINYRDSGTDDPFSSSSRRSCPKWESYAVFQKYDEEMLFLDRISAQKLHETESLRSIQACPRSISERIIHKLGTKHKTSSDYRRNPYHELEATYVAQICLTWEALNWNYKYFQRLRASRSENDPGCPAYVAQQFQQFLVLLQRYVENEPYEHGRRPEIYARMRRLAPKLLQVPEYRDSEEEIIKKETSFGSRISSDSFMLIMEEAMRTFMHFLKADRESRCRILFAAFFKRKSGLPDSALLFLLKKVNQKKKMKLRELRQSGNCLRRRRLKLNEEMEILMALIDLKIVSRVLRMRELAEEQLQWCEAKMSKVRVSDRKLQRDAAPLFFPAH